MDKKDKKVIPLGAHVLCKIVREKRESPIVLPDGSKQDVSAARLVVEAVGTGVSAGVDVRVGDELMVNQLGEKYFVDDDHVLFPEGEIIAARR